MKRTYNHGLTEEQSGKHFLNATELSRYLGLKQSTSISASIKRHGFYLNRNTRFTYVYDEDFTGLKKPFKGKLNRKWDDTDDNFGNHYTSLCVIADLYAKDKKEKNLLTIAIMKAFENEGRFVGPDGKIFTPNSCTKQNTDREPVDFTKMTESPMNAHYKALKHPSKFIKRELCNHLVNEENVQKTKETVKEHIIKTAKAKPVVSPEVKVILQKLLNDDKIEAMIDVLETFVEKEENEN